MNQSDVDKLLKRKLYLQRYVTSLYNDVTGANESSDKALITLIVEFVMDADEKTLTALSRARTSNKTVREFLSAVSAIMKEQQANMQGLFDSEMPELIQREAEVTASAVGIDTPSTSGVSSLPISGLVASAIIADAFYKYGVRLRSELVQAAASNRDAMASIIRGTKSQRFRDGLFFWRNNRLIRPNVDLIVNGTAENTALHVYKAAKVEKVVHVATLDYRTCPSCIAAESNSPYILGQQPPIPMHPRCRCRSLPYNPDSPNPMRPYVRDDRSVKDIPKSEYKKKVGQTRDSIDQFFARMTKAERLDYMGPSKFKLWEAGKIDDLGDLVNSRTLQPLRLDQLPQ